MTQYDLVVIGGGAGGMSASISAYHAGVKNILLVEKEEYLGGILNQCIHQGFGLHYFKEEMSGPNYASKLIDEVSEIDAINVSLNSFVMDIKEDKTVLISTPTKKEWISAKAIVFATGSFERHAGMINLPGKRLNGIYNAGVAQKYVNVYGKQVGKKVFILGSGDIGLIMARRMVLEGAEVVGVAELMPYSNGLTRNIVTCLEDFVIPLYLSHTVVNVHGDDNLEQVVIQEVDDKLKPIDGTDKVFDVDTLLLAVGLIPVTELMQKLNLDVDVRTKSVLVDSTYQTSMEGVFVCGNSLHVHDLVDYVSQEATIVGRFVAKYIDDGIVAKEYEIPVTCDDNFGYIIPQSLNTNNLERMQEFYFRVRRPLKDAVVSVLVDGEVVREVKKSILLPAEMEHIKVKTDNFSANNKEVKIVIKEAL